MNTNEIMHINSRYRKQDCDFIDDSHVCIRLRTGKDVQKVEIVYNDPYIRLNTNEGLFWPYYTLTMAKSGATQYCHYYSALIPCELHRLKYYFKIYDEYDCIQYSESGFTKNYKHDDLAMFFVPYISKSHVFQNPKWVEKMIWYQILPIRFNHNIKGIIEKLDYLSDLGINGLYINPIYHAYSYHKYDVIDFTKIDGDLGNEDDFKLLCDLAHHKGMKIMLDISFTHCSDLNPMFQDVLNKRKDSLYYPMFKVNETNDHQIEYECFGMIKSMPKFETENFKTITYFANDVIKKWMRLGVDCWRLDVANEISDNMLNNIRHVIKNEKKETYIVGEIWHNASEWISNNGLDGITNYALSRAILAFICDARHDIFQYRSTIDEIRHSYTLRQLKSSMPLLDSHDTPRLRTICQNDKRKVKLALLLLLTFYGTPSLYYGTERFMEGNGDPDNRRPTNWNEDNEDIRDIFQITKLFIQLRKEHPIIANDGEFEWINHQELLIIHRFDDHSSYYIVVNSREYPIDTYLPFSCQCINIIDQCFIGQNIHMDGLGFMILKEK